MESIFRQLAKDCILLLGHGSVHFFFFLIVSGSLIFLLVIIFSGVLELSAGSFPHICQYFGVCSLSVFWLVGRIHELCLPPELFAWFPLGFSLECSVTLVGWPVHTTG